MQPDITICRGDSNPVTDAVLAAFDAPAELPPEILAMPGMSGRSYRRFINTLMARLPSYMEIGSWAGSTLCSALYRNHITALAIDDWSEFEGPAEVFFRRMSACKGRSKVSFLERDYRTIDYARLASCFDPFAVYLYDGPHSGFCQYQGIVQVQPMLAPCYVQIVDDWNHPHIREATMTAIHNIGLRVNLSIAVRTTMDDTHASGPVRQDSEWHNGVFIAVVEKA